MRPRPATIAAIVGGKSSNSSSTAAPIELGLRPNLPQFALLVAINALVGGLVGVQRAVVPLIGEEEFLVGSAVVLMAFIASFGLTKASANLVSGVLADRWGRRPVLVLGWLLGLPVPFLIMWAPSFEWIVAANILLGANQGLAWSMTVVMKVDLVGPARRGLALGLNEFAGYVAVAASAWGAGMVAARWGLRPEPFWIAVGCVLLGTVLSLLFVRETRPFAQLEATRHRGATDHAQPVPRFAWVFAETSWRCRGLFAASQAGLVNNLNDGVAWGILPLLLAQRGLGIRAIALAAAIYPLSWGVGQLATGWLSDHTGRRPLIVLGMWVQAGAHLLIGLDVGGALVSGVVGAFLLGVGTAMVYPTLLASIGDQSSANWRARALSVYRFWRDLGYVVGAIASGLIADALGFDWSIHAAGMLTFVSGVVALRWLPRGKHAAQSSALPT